MIAFVNCFMMRRFTDSLIHNFSAFIVSGALYSAHIFMT